MLFHIIVADDPLDQAERPIRYLSCNSMGGTVEILHMQHMICCIRICLTDFDDPLYRMKVKLRFS